MYDLTVKYFSNQVDMGSISRLLLVLVSSLTGCLSSSDIEPTLVSVSLGSKVSLSCDQDRAQWTLTNNGTTLTIEGRNIKMLLLKFDLEFFSDDEDNYEIEDKKLSISDIGEAQLGVYSCEYEGRVIRSFHLDTSLKIRKFPKSVSVNDGLPKDLLCTLNSHVCTR